MNKLDIKTIFIYFLSAMSGFIGIMFIGTTNEGYHNFYYNILSNLCPNRIEHTYITEYGLLKTIIILPLRIIDGFVSCLQPGSRFIFFIIFVIVSIILIILANKRKKRIISPDNIKE